MGVAGGKGPLRWVVEDANAAATREEMSSPLRSYHRKHGHSAPEAISQGRLVRVCWLAWMKKPVTVPSKSTPRMLQRNRQDDATFSEIVQLIASSCEKALQAVNTALIDLYREVGATISRKIATVDWCDGIVDCGTACGIHRPHGAGTERFQASQPVPYEAVL